MSLHYLLDGYNIVHQIPMLTRGALEDQRNNLLRLIESRRPQGSVKNKVTVVFDGKAGIWGGPQDSSVEVIFTKVESADDRIKAMVASAPNRKSIVVVTNDRDIQYAVRACGAGVKTVQEFFPRSSPPPPRAPRADKDKNARQERTAPKKPIPKTLEHEITSEFERLWVEKKKDKT